MCGICGYVGIQKSVDPSVIQRMNTALTHRGPDSDGLYTFPEGALAMRRLKIIDIAEGDQPIFNEDHSIAIVFNGEIYNFKTLRERLIKDGHVFRTHTDTECILHAYETWGLDCLEHLNGMFAFAIWDTNTRRLFLARDRTGIKPLYYMPYDDGLLFASELKALLEYPGLRLEIDPTALDQYLTFEYIPAPRSIFKSVHKLPPGHAISYQDGQMRRWQYWDLRLEKSENNTSITSLGQAAEELRAILKDVVQQEMVSDVPLGVLLSGGVDSSSVAALMAQVSSRPIKSFSIAFEDASFDESRFAHMAARHIGTEHHELCLTAPMVIELLPRIGEYMDEPLADSSFVPTMLLAGFTRESVTVALGGDGGDEIFAGYSTLQAHRLMTIYKNVVPNPLRRLAEAAVHAFPASFRNISLDFKLKRFSSGDRLPFEMRHHYWLGSFDPDAKHAVLRRMQDQQTTFETVQEHLQTCNAEQLLNRVLYLDMKMYLDGDILPKVDRASMSHSLEVRVPFLNHEILKFADRLPIQHKLNGLTTKAVLREAMRPYLPPEIARRGKKGFNMPVAKWLTEELRDWAHDLLAYDRLKRQGIFKPEGVQKLLNDHMQHKRDARKQLWTLLVFQMWMERWHKG